MLALIAASPSPSPPRRHPVAAVRSNPPAARFVLAQLFILVSVVTSSYGCIGADTAAAPDPSAVTIDDDAGFVVALPEFDGSWIQPATARDASLIVAPPQATTPPSDPGIVAAIDGGPPSEAASGPSLVDSSTPDKCPGLLGPGDLAIDELMITSVAGSGDDGEWIEIQSTRDCSLDLQGLHGECPDGAKVRSFDVGSAMTLPPFGTFLVADSSDPAVNHQLPGALLVWAGHVGDVLRKAGATITLTMNGTLVDSVTYPSLKLAVGQSLAFPSDCDPSVRSDWTVWQPSIASWFPAFFGTPNAPNDDVHCPYRPSASSPDASSSLQDAGTGGGDGG